jgi:flagellar hook-length control protein FliK
MNRSSIEHLLQIAAPSHELMPPASGRALQTPLGFSDRLREFSSAPPTTPASRRDATDPVSPPVSPRDLSASTPGIDEPPNSRHSGEPPDGSLAEQPTAAAPGEEGRIEHVPSGDDAPPEDANEHSAAPPDDSADDSQEKEPAAAAEAATVVMVNQPHPAVDVITENQLDDANDVVARNADIVSESTDAKKVYQAAQFAEIDAEFQTAPVNARNTTDKPADANPAGPLPTEAGVEVNADVALLLELEADGDKSDDAVTVARETERPGIAQKHIIADGGTLPPTTTTAAEAQVAPDVASIAGQQSPEPLEAGNAEIAKGSPRPRPTRSRGSDAAGQHRVEPTLPAAEETTASEYSAKAVAPRPVEGAVAVISAPRHPGASKAEPTGDTKTPSPPAAEIAVRGPRGGTAAKPGEVSQTPELNRADTTRFIGRVTRAFHFAQERGGMLQLRLSPPELGSLRLELNVKDGVLTANLETETSAARLLLLEHLPVLRDRLAEQNIRVDRFDVDVRREGTDDRSETPQQQFQRREPQHREPARSQPAARPERAAPIGQAGPIAARPQLDSISRTEINLIV